MGRLAGIGFLVTAAIFGVGIGVVGVARLTYRDLFAPYQALMPENSIDGLKAFACHLTEATNTKPGSCTFNVGATFPARVTVEEYNQIIVKTDFLIPGTHLRLGDLILCWGGPGATFLNVPPHSSPSLELYWTERTYASLWLAQADEQPAYFTPIYALSISDPPPDCRSGE